MLGKYLVSLARREVGFLVLLKPFFFFSLLILLLFSFSWLSLALPQMRALATSQKGDTGLSNPPAARVGEAGCCPPREGVGRFPGLPDLTRPGQARLPQETCSSTHILLCLLLLKALSPPSPASL